jgi:hypothetical protein
MKRPTVQSQIFTSWKRITGWLGRVDGIRIGA